MALWPGIHIPDHYCQSHIYIYSLAFYLWAPLKKCIPWIPFKYIYTHIYMSTYIYTFIHSIKSFNKPSFVMAFNGVHYKNIYILMVICYFFWGERVVAEVFQKSSTTRLCGILILWGHNLYDIGEMNSQIILVKYWLNIFILNWL